MFIKFRINVMPLDITSTLTFFYFVQSVIAVFCFQNLIPIWESNPFESRLETPNLLHWGFLIFLSPTEHHNAGFRIPTS